MVEGGREVRLCRLKGMMWGGSWRSTVGGALWGCTKANGRVPVSMLYNLNHAKLSMYHAKLSMY